MSWEELQPLTIIPLYRDLDAQRGAEYAKYEYEADQGRVVAAQLCLRDAGYTILPALKERERFQVSYERDWDRFRVCAPGERFAEAKVWTCQELLAEALRLRAKRAVSEQLALSA